MLLFLAGDMISAPSCLQGGVVHPKTLLHKEQSSYLDAQGLQDNSGWKVQFAIYICACVSSFFLMNCSNIFEREIFISLASSGALPVRNTQLCS